MEELKIIGAAMAAVVALFSIYKTINEVTLSRVSRHRDDYQFTKEYLEDLYSADVHTFILEKGFRALTNELYSIAEIKTLLSYSEPTKAIQLRANSEEFIEFDNNSQNYRWRSCLKNKHVRRFVNRVFFTLYGISSFVIIYPLTQGLVGSIEIYTLPVSTSIILGILSFFLLLKYIKISEAINFMALTNG